MKEEDIKFLMLIGSTEDITFNELCSALGDLCPLDKSEWRELFQRIRTLENDGYLDVTRTNGKIDGLMLTEQGAGMVRDRLDAARGLLRVL